MTWTIHNGDCLEVLRTLPAASVDAVVTDPPYGLSFMGKRWDYDVPAVEVWQECLRVLKPGGHLLAFAGTRTQHRMAVRIEDAGFEIRDMIAWVYGSGFPKSHNLDGAWRGWGTALKPALEPITVARKPLGGTVADNVLEHGTGALNVDGCRVGTDGGTRKAGEQKFGWDGSGTGASIRVTPINAGRWPSNLIHDGSEEVVGLFPQAGGGYGVRGKGGQTYASGKGFANTLALTGQEVGYGDSGSAARFFYCAKASKRDRGDGCEGLPIRQTVGGGGLGNPVSGAYGSEESPGRNHHPTVKPTALMRYLCRLVTPPGGVVLDPFTGSGSTGKASILEHFNFIGIEREAEYCEIARARISKAERDVSKELL